MKNGGISLLYELKNTSSYKYRKSLGLDLKLGTFKNKVIMCSEK